METTCHRRAADCHSNGTIQQQQQQRARSSIPVRWSSSAADAGAGCRLPFLCWRKAPNALPFCMCLERALQIDDGAIEIPDA